MACLQLWRHLHSPSKPRAPHNLQLHQASATTRKVALNATSPAQADSCNVELPPAVQSLTHTQQGSKFELQLLQAHHGFVGRNDTIIWLDEDVCLALRTRGPACSFSMDVSFSNAQGPCTVQQWQSYWRQERLRTSQSLSDALVIAAAQAPPSKKSGAHSRALKQYRKPLAVVAKTKQTAPSSSCSGFRGSYCGVHVVICNPQHRGAVAAQFLRAPSGKELLIVEQLVGYKLRWPLCGTNTCSWCGAVCLTD